jgi:hypothetical protein
MKRALSSTVVFAFAAGCTHSHFQRNAPGNIDVRSPSVANPPPAGTTPEPCELRIPPELRTPKPGAPPPTKSETIPCVHEVQDPQDPGEQAIVLTFGALAGGGFVTGPGRNIGSSYGLGPEVSIHYGRSAGSHREDFGFTIPPYPETTTGLNIGWTMLTGEGRGVGPLYLEAQHAGRLYGIAAGWAWDPNDTSHGPQSTAFVGPFYARLTHFFGQSTQVTFGLVLKGYSCWYWSF